MNDLITASVPFLQVTYCEKFLSQQVECSAASFSYGAITYVLHDPLAIGIQPPHSSHYICKNNMCVISSGKDNFFFYDGEQ